VPWVKASDRAVNNLVRHVEMDCWSKIFYMVDAVPNSQPAACENTEYMLIFILFVTSDKFIVVVNYYSVVRCTTILSDIQHGFLMSSSVIAFYGQPHYCYRPYYPTARFRSPWRNHVHYTWSLLNRFQTGQGPRRANLLKWGLPITFLWLWPATDHEPNCRH